MRTKLTQISLVHDFKVIGFAQSCFGDIGERIVPFPIPRQFTLSGVSIEGEVPEHLDIKINIKDCEIEYPADAPWQIRIVNVYDETGYSFSGCKIISVDDKFVSGKITQIKNIVVEQL